MDSRSLQRKTEVICGNENALGMGIHFMQNVRNKMDIYFDFRAPRLLLKSRHTRKDILILEREMER